MSASQKYLLCGSAVLFLLFAVTFVASALVDPYYVFDRPGLPGFNALKPRVYDQIEIAKPLQLERAAANTLILGNSRFEIGLDPSSKSFPKSAQPVFDGAMAGRSLFVARRLLQDTVAIHPPKTLIVGLDFPDYLRAEYTGTLEEPPLRPLDYRLYVDRSGKPNPWRLWQRTLDLLTASMTLGALYDSGYTVLDQNPHATVTMTPRGFDPLNEYRVEVRRIGEYGLFAQKNAIYNSEYSQYRPSYFVHPELNSEFHELKQIIEIAARAHMRIELVIYPYHVEYLELLHRYGLWTSFCSWKEAVLQLVEGERHVAGANVHLWDFSGYDETSRERVPSADDRRTQTSWYWEPGHFKSALGDRILAAIYRKSTAFGIELGPDSLKGDIVRIDEDRSRYLASNDHDEHR